MKKNKVLSVFDFDGTLTYGDSFFAFLLFTFNKLYFYKRLCSMILPTFQYMCRQLTRDELKSMLVITYLKDIDVNLLSLLADTFCRKNWKKIMRPEGIIAIKKEINTDAEVVVCSATPELVLQPFSQKLGVKLISTQLEVTNGKLTGKINGRNCRCIEKIKRLEKVYGTLKNYYLRVWGDSRGDYELLSIAQEAYWRYFHQFIIFFVLFFSYQSF